MSCISTVCIAWIVLSVDGELLLTGGLLSRSERQPVVRADRVGWGRRCGARGARAPRPARPAAAAAASAHAAAAQEVTADILR